MTWEFKSPQAHQCPSTSVGGFLFFSTAPQSPQGGCKESAATASVIADWEMERERGNSTFVSRRPAQQVLNPAAFLSINGRGFFYFDSLLPR